MPGSTRRRVRELFEGLPSSTMPLYRRPAALFLIALLFFIAGTWSLPLIDRDEPRFAEAAREMRQGGDYVVPYFNHGYRFDKPPLTYWLQVAAYRLFGENDFAARLPSVLAGALTVLVVFAFATRLHGASAGASAALIFMTCLQTFMHARGAVADMLMVLFFTLAIWSGWELIDARKADGRGRACLTPGGWWLIFYGALALGFLAKGPVAWLPLGAVVWYAAVRKPGGISRRFRFGLGMAVTLALFGLWGIPALMRTSGAFFTVGIGKHVVARSLSPMEGHGAGQWWSYLAMLPFYLVTVFLSFFPWSVRLPWLVARLRRSANSGNSERQAQSSDGQGGENVTSVDPDSTLYLLVAIALVFGVFTLVRTKLPHYTLPAFPLMAILLAGELPAAGGGTLKIDRLAGAALAVGLVLALLGFPLIAGAFPGRVLILQAGSALTPEMEFASCDYQEPSLVWYARSRVRGWYSPMSCKKLPKFMARPGPRFCVAPVGAVKPEPGWKVFRHDGFNVVHWKKESLELLVKPR